MGKLSKIQLLSASILISLAVAVLFGPLHMMGMEINEDGEMGRCIFTDNEVCIMSVSDHLLSWTRLFTVIPSDFTKVIFTLASLLILYLTSKRYLIYLQFRLQLSRIKFYILFWSNIFSLTPLRRAFARGILNPKIF